MHNDSPHNTKNRRRADDLSDTSPREQRCEIPVARVQLQPAVALMGYDPDRCADVAWTVP